MSVAENTTTVTTVTAIDPDPGAVLSFSIVGGADQARFSIVAATGVLAFNVAPDFENPTDAGPNNVYDVLVQVSDGQGGFDAQAIAVTVTDVNEAPTAVGFDNTTTAVDENTDTSAGLKVADIVVVDDALGSETLALTGADAASFEIVGSELRLKAGVLDFETKNSYSVQVTADDTTVGGSPDATSALFIVNVNDVNAAPVITSGTAESVAENTSTATVVHDASATDDGENSGTLSFSFGGGADDALFSIDADDGEVRFLASPDFEAPADAGADNVYNIVVRASDGTLSTDQAVAITVTNVIEPLFTDNADTVNFNAVVAGTYIDGTQYDALGGDDIVTLPTSSAQAAAAGFDSTQTFHGGAGNDNIMAGGSLDNLIDGDTGNDTISGGAGKDTLAGGAGQDDVNGSSGDDRITMLVTAGDVDTIDAGSGDDTLLLSGVAPGDGVVVVDLSAADQVVSIGGVADALMQQGFENLDASGLGSSVDATGSNAANTIVGSNGDDTINAGDGDDTISGGAGNDTLMGGGGNDTYRFGLADGFDTINDASGGSDTIIIEANGAALSSLNFSRSGANDLVIEYNGQQITVLG